jgi:hypothetical protein
MYIEVPFILSGGKGMEKRKQHKGNKKFSRKFFATVGLSKNVCGTFEENFLENFS